MYLNQEKYDTKIIDKNYQQTELEVKEINNDSILYKAVSIYKQNKEENIFKIINKNNDWLIDNFIFPYKIN